MKKIFIMLILGVTLWMFGCGETGMVNPNKSATSPKQSEPGKETYWERTEDLGFQKESLVQLESNPDNTDLRMVIDGYSVNLQNEKGIIHENYNFTKMRAKDFDKDGIKEILLLFFGGSSGTYQNFCMIKYNGQNWEVVPIESNSVNDTSFVKVKTLKNNLVQIDVAETGYKKEVNLAGNDYLTQKGKKAVVDIGYRFFELQDREIVVAYRLYTENVGNAFGDVRQRIQLNRDGSKLILGKTEYMPINEAKARNYEKFY